MNDGLELFDLSGMVAIVTGSGGLLGRQHCDALASAGATVYATDKDMESMSDWDSANQMKLTTMDVTDRQSIKSTCDSIIDNHGGIDILVNNAAVNDMVEKPISGDSSSKFEDYPVELWRTVLEVNVTGSFLTSQVIGAHMAERRSGSIVNVASTYGVVAPDQSIYQDANGKQEFFKSAAYPVSKSAVLMLTRYLASYWGTSGVRVNALSPGGVENGQSTQFISNYSNKTPMGRMATPTDYKGALIFLASRASSYMTGHNLLVDGGWTTW